MANKKIWKPILFALWVGLLFTACISLGPLVTATITSVQTITYEEPEVETYYLYVDEDTWEIIETKRPSRINKKGEYVNNPQGTRETGRMITKTKVKIILSDGTEFFAGNDLIKEYNFQEGQTIVYRQDEAGKPYLESVH